MRIDVIVFGNSHPNININWSLGSIHKVEASVISVNLMIKNIMDECEAIFFIDNITDLPSEKLITELLSKPQEIFHAGLKSGLSEELEFLNFVNPTWMLQINPDKNSIATSWRVALNCCLIKTDVFKQLGVLNADFLSLDGASLEFGYRCIRRGVFIRHIPDLLPEKTEQRYVNISAEDQVKFILLNHGKKWSYWSIFRALMVKKINLIDVRKYFKLIKAQRYSPYPIYKKDNIFTTPKFLTHKVSILIPTIDRYSYLRTLLQQLRQQTIRPFEILIIDQTPLKKRDLKISDDFLDLPIRYFVLEEPGQCNSRNFGLNKSRGDYILFLDDDDEIEPDLIQNHLISMLKNQCNISCGVANETGAGELPENFTFVRISDVFPTNNTMIKKSIISKTGLFDLAFNRGQNEDHDLGIRIYKSGELMVLDPNIKVMHHHAPQGGLRTHKARVNTYASSRKNINNRILPTNWEIYLVKRYFTKNQVREKFWLGILGTFSYHGSTIKKIFKASLSLIMLPFSINELIKRNKAADRMLLKYPQIPQLDDE